MNTLKKRHYVAYKPARDSYDRLALQIEIGVVPDKCIDDTTLMYMPDSPIPRNYDVLGIYDDSESALVAAHAFHRTCYRVESLRSQALRLLESVDRTQIGPALIPIIRDSIESCDISAPKAESFLTTLVCHLIEDQKA